MAREKRGKQIATQLGLKIRDIRREKKVTLIELSRLTEVAQATLSRIETGLMIGTVESHEKIAEALGVSLAQLYEGIDKRYNRIAHQNASDQRKVTAKTDDMCCELLTHEISKKKMIPLLITLAGHGKSQMEETERGVEKLFFVLEGSVKMLVGEKEYLLSPQDTLYFDGSIPHQIINGGAKQAKLFCTISPSKI